MILDLSKHADKQVQVRLSGGRQVRGVLKGWDPLLNLVLDEAVEDIRGKPIAALFLLSNIGGVRAC